VRECAVKGGVVELYSVETRIGAGLVVWIGDWWARCWDGGWGLWEGEKSV